MRSPLYVKMNEEPIKGQTLAGLYWESPFGKQALLLLLCLVLALAARPWLHPDEKNYPCIGRSVGLTLGVLSLALLMFWYFTSMFSPSDPLPSFLDPKSMPGTSLSLALVGLVFAATDAVLHWRALHHSRRVARALILASHGCALTCCWLPIHLLKLSWQSVHQLTH